MTGVIISLMYEVVQIREAELRARSKEEELHAMAQELNRLKHVEAKLRAKEEEVNALKQELANTMSECIFWCHFRRTPFDLSRIFPQVMLWCELFFIGTNSGSLVNIKASSWATVCSALPASIGLGCRLWCTVLYSVVLYYIPFLQSALIPSFMPKTNILRWVPWSSPLVLLVLCLKKIFIRD